MELKAKKHSMLHWFEYKHLNEDLQKVSKEFFNLAEKIEKDITPGRERSVAMRKLLEAKDAAVRSKLFPGA